MSRSYRHTPIMKSGRRESNRWFKTNSHRSFRRKEQEALLADIEQVLPPTKMRDVSEIWSSKQEYKYKCFYIDRFFEVKFVEERHYSTIGRFWYMTNDEYKDKYEARYKHYLRRQYLNIIYK